MTHKIDDIEACEAGGVTPHVPKPVDRSPMKKKGLFTKSRFRYDGAKELRAQLQAVTGERIAALEGIGETVEAARDRAVDAAGSDGRSLDSGPEAAAAKEVDGRASQEKVPEPPARERSRESGMDLEL